MLKPTRTVLALTAGSLVLGLAGAGAAVADTDPMPDMPGHAAVVADDDGSDLLRPDGQQEYRHARGVVVAHGKLTVRNRPSTHAYKVGVVFPHQKLAIECKKRGERVNGNNLWYRLDGRNENNGMDGVDGMGGGGGGHVTKDEKDHERWVAARYVKNLTPVKWCY
ncbi:hypothetical protein ACFWBF_02280 [Streptomyces sp. NPDC060028]|uniref:hypothetical protein n=1 Tax=Streptomyces sp. NPDC060028 TaxID=3347041 RepID=UPI0036A1839A